MPGRRVSPWKRLRDTNPTVALGVVLLAAGLAMGLLPGRSGPGSDTAATLNHTLSGLIQLTQRAILWGDDAVGDPQFRFNAAVVAVFVESLSPGQQATLGAATELAQSLLGDLFSLPGLLTLVALIATYVAVAHAFDARYPQARRRE